MRRAIPLTLLLVACGGPPDPAPAVRPERGREATESKDAPSPVRPGPERAERVERREAPESKDAPTSPADAYLAAHNAFRKQHCAPPLAWSAELAKVAQGWADQLKKAGCAFEHSRTRYGENLAAGTSGALDPARTTEMWYREVDKYDWKKGGFSMETGHFTQVVWAGTQRIGCGMTTCKGLDVIVCNYDPPGNVHGQYAANVKPTSCK
ncbi:MAG: hypothetical protein F9K40_11070 [Kofleriaceae bacterium]|nr:MAG: hypothetical protein F9K40_11070 [Kofleriaceae bacterium]MBZ0238867.1 CAP family protein [Kofleriaceae bacterium]